MSEGNRREFLKSSLGAACAAAVPGALLGESSLPLATAARPDAPAIKKGMVLTMLPEKLSMADRFKLARDTGFEVIQAPTTDARQADEIKAAADASGVRVDSVMN